MNIYFWLYPWSPYGYPRIEVMFLKIMGRLMIAK